MIQILTGDSFELIKDLPDNSVDLVITSPPYADIVSYGKNVSIKKSNDYVDWLLPLFNEIHRVLKPTGSFILNINDNTKGGYRNTFIYELIYRNSKETPLKLYDTYIWHKTNGIPNGSKKRFRNNTEFIFHFCKDTKLMKFYMDRVLEEPKNKDKHKSKVKIRRTNKQVDSDGLSCDNFVDRIVPDKVRPDNVFRFSTAGASRDNDIRHPAPFHRELPEYFINLLTDENDVVLDVFSGIGTTGLPCRDLDRNYIGFELNSTYADFSIKRLNGEKETYLINQYDLDDNFIRSWNTITEIETTLGFDSHNHIEDCIRKGNKTSYGYKWKLENKQYDIVISQFDLEGNYIASFDGITSAAKSIGYSTPHNILMCYRGFRNEAGGYKWILENKQL